VRPDEIRGGSFNVFKARLQSWLARQPWVYWLVEPLVPILHPSPWRLRLFGLALATGNLLFGWIWTELIPQPYESVWLRSLMSALGLVLVLPWLTQNLASPTTRVLVAVVAWIELPLFFSWMYLCNGSGVAWLTSLSAMILIYYHMTDWRIASVGVLCGGLVAWALFQGFAPNDFYLANTERLLDEVVIAFSWGCALLLGLSSANLRREHLANTLTTVGIMAHELRTPLSTAALIGDAIQLEAQRQPAAARTSAAQLEKLASRLHTLVRNMNHQIDTEIANAKLLDLPHYSETVRAAQLVRDVVSNYPFSTTRQRDCVQIVIHHDFSFLSSRSQFSQVLDNLIKNALHSLMAADSRYALGALRIEVGLQGNRGRIVVSDDGMGMDAAVLRQIFKPFFSNKRGTGHGLGLAFCQRVVRSAGGSIAVKSDFAVGAAFTIELPVATLQFATSLHSVNP
jgi:two-component system, CAI-1 autoinducer sensor kinase/phosphatase CqsS